MTLNELITQIRGDLNPLDNGLKSFFRSYFVNSSFRLLYNHRLSKYFSSSKFKIVRIIGLKLCKKQLYNRGCQISKKAIIGKNLRFPHPIGIVIGDNVIIKDNVKIWQQVTLGSHGKINSQLDYPIIEDNVKIYAGAKILGGITIGQNSIIGANAVVLTNVPANSTAVGIPARIIQKK